MTISDDLRDPAQVAPTFTKVICIAPDAAIPGAYSVESAGTLPGNAHATAIMKQIERGERKPLPPRKNPFDLTIKAATKIVFHLDEANWFFTDAQMRLKDGSSNDTPNPGGGINREFGSLGWVNDNGSDRQKTISIVDTWRRMETFEYGLFLIIKQGNMEVKIEVDPQIINEDGD